MKIIITDSYKTIEEHYTVNSLKFNHQPNQKICFKFVVYTPYTLLSQLCKFYKNQTSSLDVLVV